MDGLTTGAKSITAQTPQQQAQELDWILGQGYSINLYMFHGGTSFGFMNGANWEKQYEPDVTSYDYDSPVSESGALTKKYFAFREVIAKHRPGVRFPDPPAALPVIDIPEFELRESAPLWMNLPNSISVKAPRAMETFGESYGYILYRTRIEKPVSGELEVRELRSYARVYVNGKLAGTVDRRLKAGSPADRRRAAGSTLDILVEGTGRINFTTELRSERQGINGAVTLGWTGINWLGSFSASAGRFVEFAVFKNGCGRAGFLSWRILL